MPEYTPQQLDEFRLNQQIDAMIARDKARYADRKWLMEPSRREPKVLKDKRESRNGSSRGSKKGVKRGPYRKRQLLLKENA